MLCGQFETWSVADGGLLYWRREGLEECRERSRASVKYAKKQANVWVSSVVEKSGCFKLPGFCRPGSRSVLWDSVIIQLAALCIPATESTFQHPNSTSSWSIRAMWIYSPQLFDWFHQAFHPADHYIACWNKTESCVSKEMSHWGKNEQQQSQTQQLPLK